MLTIDAEFFVSIPSGGGNSASNSEDCYSIPHRRKNFKTGRLCMFGIVFLRRNVYNAKQQIIDRIT